MNKAATIAIPAVAGVAVGFTLGWVFSARRLNKFFTAQVGELNETYNDALERVGKTGRYATVQGAAEAVLQSPFSDIQTEVEEEAKPIFATPDEASNLEGPEIEPETDEEASVRNMATFAERFKERDANLPNPGVTLNGEALSQNADEEDTPTPTTSFVTVRDANAPYVISIDDYMEDEEAFTKQEMTYFEGDGILIDARESIVGSLREDRAGIDRTIGVQNLDRWGQGTTDKDQVYIRNERLGIDVEVTRDEGTYTRTVLGIRAEDEIERSMQKPLKMREGDDS